MEGTGTYNRGTWPSFSLISIWLNWIGFFKNIPKYRRQTLPVSWKLYNNPYTFSLRRCTFVVPYKLSDLNYKSPCMENFLIWQDIMNLSMDCCSRQRYNLRTHCSDRISIAYSCHTNLPIKIKFLYGNCFICDVYYIIASVQPLIACKAL